MKSPRIEELRRSLIEADRSEQGGHARYLSSLDNSPIGRTESAPAAGSLFPVTGPAQLLSPNVKQPKRRRNVVGSKQQERVGQSTGTVYAVAIGESIDIGWIEARWQDHREQVAMGNGTKPSEFPDIDALFGGGLVESAISIEKQVSYWKIFDGLDCFVFAFGSLVCWDVTEQQLETLQSRLMPFVGKSIAEPKRDRVVYTAASARRERELAAAGSDGEGEAVRLKPKIVYGNIQLTSVNSFEKLAYSYAMAQSVRLDVFEDDIERAISATSQIPIHLAKVGTVGLSNRQVTVKMGELFLQRSNVNLHSDILDTPELFWEFDEYEQMYILGRSYLDIDKRIEILNQRLDILKDLYEMLQNELNVKHSAKIEIIIIVLILAEIVLQVLGMVISWMTGVQVFER
jgi:uncharacterized Rmd1/YagE family protein